MQKTSMRKKCFLCDSDDDDDEDYEPEFNVLSVENEVEEDDLDIVPMDEEMNENEEAQIEDCIGIWRDERQVSLFRQYIANKRHKYGLKLCMLTEPNGLILNFAVYTGQLDELGGKRHA